jgi:hypothetical protein
MRDTCTKTRIYNHYNDGRRKKGRVKGKEEVREILET